MAIKDLIQQNVDNFKSSVTNKVSNLGNQLKSQAINAVDPTGILQQLLGAPSSIPTALSKTTTSAKVKGTDADWRVRLSLPNNAAVSNSDIFAPLVETNGLVFPYTPTILIQHTANYDAMQPIHSNYPYLNYQNSQIDDLVITGDFFCENAVDAQYWVAVLHYLRTCTKMNYGQSSDQGAPPPVVFLNGYGDFVFPNVPVVIRNFSVDLPADVDYIKTQADGVVSVSAGTTSVDGFYEGWAPVQSQIMITVAPVYSRSKTAGFSLDDFASGGYLGAGQNGGGFI
jgi:hypothetical protein